MCHLSWLQAKSKPFPVCPLKLPEWKPHFYQPYLQEPKISLRALLKGAIEGITSALPAPHYWGVTWLHLHARKLNLWNMSQLPQSNFCKSFSWNPCSIFYKPWKPIVTSQFTSVGIFDSSPSCLLVRVSSRGTCVRLPKPPSLQCW